tara:strand:+ start:7807 stop:8640 length:834 start_codon:yes stop_codon:yes gene_type:complete
MSLDKLIIKSISRDYKLLIKSISRDYNLPLGELYERYLGISAGPAEAGLAYEMVVHSVISKCLYKGELFCTQSVKDLGGSSSENDLKCNFGVNIEAKKYPNPDWTQIKLENCDGLNWVCGEGKRLHPEVRTEFARALPKGTLCTLWDGKVPSFAKNPITHDQWLEEKESFKDEYRTCESSQISSFYKKKGSAYIQVQKKGLFHTGKDVLDFGVPYFECPQRFRIRPKVHKRGDPGCNANLSVTAACQPEGKIEINSPYSLDDPSKLPPSLVYDHNLR